MAVTAHYSVEVNKRLVLRTRLIAFRHVGGSHTGKRLAEEFLAILKQFRLCERVCPSLVLISTGSLTNRHF